MKQTRKILKELNPTYKITTIDFEEVIYKDYGDFDIEVSGLDNQSKFTKGKIFCWDKTNGLKIERQFDFSNKEELKNILRKIDKCKTIEEVMKIGG